MIKFPENDIHRYHKRQKDPLTWGAHEFSIVEPRLKNRRTCLDIGAHIGVTALRFAKHFQQVHSFEPIVYDYLVENTKHLSNITPHHRAVSDHKGTVEMYPNPLNSTGGIIPADYNTSTIERRYTGDNPQMSNVETIMVECVPIDSFNFENVDFIKIDVEGYIVPVMRGMIETLTKSSPVIQMELSFEDQNKQVDDMLSSLGYKVYANYRRDIFYYRETT